MVRTVGLQNYSNVHFTDREVALRIINHFKPQGRILEPFRGDGAFYDQLPSGTHWCEIDKGRDFLLTMSKLIGSSQTHLLKI